MIWKEYPSIAGRYRLFDVLAVAIGLGYKSTPAYDFANSTEAEGFCC
jgi:hypothetical protein